MSYPCISILQPYAWLIVNGHKDIENRGWRTGFRGRILIHAGKTYSRRTHDEYTDRWKVLGSWGFVLKDQRACPFEPYRGQLGIFRVPVDAIRTTPTDAKGAT